MSAPVSRKTAVFLSFILLLFSLTIATLSFAAPEAIDELFSVQTETIHDPGPRVQNSMSTLTVNGRPAILFSDREHLYYQRALDANGNVWPAPTPIVAGDIYFERAAFSIVNGLPTLVYQNNADTTYNFLQVTDASGTSWGAPVALPFSIYPKAVLEVDGNPAVLYYDFLNPGNLYYVRANNPSGTSWGTAVAIASGSRYFEEVSMAIVNGKPAVLYTDYTNRILLYVQAADALGTVWNSPETILANTHTDHHGVLMVVDGRPAISFFGGPNFSTKLYFIRANDADGNSWGQLQLLDNGAYVGLYSSLILANGKPAIIYENSVERALYYVQATDAAGSNWGTPQLLDDEGGSVYGAWAIVTNGRPAAAYRGNGGLKFISANNADGSSWQSYVGLSGSYSGIYGSLEIVNGNPAVSYMDSGNKDLYYQRATDALGQSWGAPQLIDQQGTVGSESQLAIINGKPAIAYFESNSGSELNRGGGATSGSVKFVQATDASGTNWGTPVTLFSGTEYLYELDLVVHNGKPAVTFVSNIGNARGGNSSLFYFVGAADADGSSWDTPTLITGGVDIGIEDTGVSIVNGLPAATYIFYDNSGSQNVWGVGFQQASNASATSWSSRTLIYTSTNDVYAYDAIDIVEVNGHPAIIFQEEDENGQERAPQGGSSPTIYRLKYTRANDAQGSSWPTAVSIVERTGEDMEHVDLMVHNGVPILGFSDDDEQTSLIRAQDQNGTAWGEELSVQSDNEWEYLSLAAAGDDLFMTAFDDDDIRLEFVHIAPTVTLTATNLSIVEGNEGATQAEITITRSGSSTTAVSFSYTISGGTATAEDFVGGTLPSGTISFGAGETSQTLTLAVSGDDLVETDETFQLALSDSDAGGNFSTLTLTISNDDSDTSFIFLPFVVSE